ncbi:uncharacterized protein PAC_08766 [Phialocephala subalpina]|uniref:Uncharacterized protein n=1 Tax=Phialocephala subalpina TaxID=576137 RepID=A0A1L7X1G5_9HELO|nr:uncharacterized protein PAC_08766 [Phialocephala subalpina]
MLPISSKHQTMVITSYDTDRDLIYEASSNGKIPSPCGTSTTVSHTFDASTFQFVDELTYRNPNHQKQILSVIRSRAKLDYHAKQRKAGVRFGAPKRTLLIAPSKETGNACPHSNVKVSCVQCRHSNTSIKRAADIRSSRASQKQCPIKREGFEGVDSLVRGTWREDPFNVYNLPDDPRVPLLVSHFNERFRQTYTTPLGHRVNFIVNLTNPILQHGILYHTGAFLLARNSSIVDDSFVTCHRTRSMQLVGRALDDPIQRCSDQTIVALLYLILYEVSFCPKHRSLSADNMQDMYGTPETATIHRNGLHEVLKVRKKEGRRISWFLRMSLPLCELHILTDGKVDLSNSSDLNDGILTVVPSELQISDYSMRTIFNRLKDVAYNISVLPSSTSLRDRRRIGYETKVKIERFLKILDIDSKRTETDRDTHRSWLFASLIYLHTIVATSDEMYILPEKDIKIVHELKGVVERLMDIPEDLGYSTRVLLWVLFFGALHSKGKEYMWFRKTIRERCKEMKLETWVEVKEELKDLPWVQQGVEWKLKALCGLY